MNPRMQAIRWNSGAKPLALRFPTGRSNAEYSSAGHKSDWSIGGKILWHMQCIRHVEKDKEVVAIKKIWGLYCGTESMLCLQSQHLIFITDSNPGFPTSIQPPTNIPRKAVDVGKICGLLKFK